MPIEGVTHGVVSRGGAEHATCGVFVEVRLLQAQARLIVVIVSSGGDNVQVAVVPEIII